MKKLDMSSVTTAIAFPPKGGTWTFLQLAYQEALAAAAQTIVGTQFAANEVYVLFGCVNSGVGSNYNISAGAVLYWDGVNLPEVFLVPAATFTITGPNVAEGSIQTSFYTGQQADPVTFTDNTPRNVHQIRQVEFAPGLAGSGIVNFANLVYISKMPVGGIGQLVDWMPPTYDTSWFTAGLGTNPHVLGWAIADGTNGTVAAAGAVTVGYKSGDANFGTIQANGNPVGSATHALTSGENGPHSHEIAPDNIAGHGAVGVIYSGSPNQNITGGGAGGGGSYSIDATQSSGAGTPHNNIQPSVTVLKLQRIA